MFPETFELLRERGKFGGRIRLFFLTIRQFRFNTRHEITFNEFGDRKRPENWGEGIIVLFSRCLVRIFDTFSASEMIRTISLKSFEHPSIFKVNEPSLVDTRTFYRRYLRVLIGY